MSKSVNTVMGPISIDDLGKTLIHEHFAVSYTHLDVYKRQV